MEKITTDLYVYKSLAIIVSFFSIAFQLFGIRWLNKIDKLCDDVNNIKIKYTEIRTEFFALKKEHDKKYDN